MDNAFSTPYVLDAIRFLRPQKSGILFVDGSVVDVQALVEAEWPADIDHCDLTVIPLYGLGRKPIKNAVVQMSKWKLLLIILGIYRG